MKTKLLLIVLLLATTLTTLALGRRTRSGDDVVYISMSHAGELEAQMPQGMHNRVRVLIVEGPINGKDLDYMKKLGKRTRVVDRNDKSIDNYLDIDLEGARIESGGGGIFSSTRSTRDEIGSSTFSYCSHLRSIVLPPRTVEIGNRAFYDCDELEEVVMGRYISRIGESAFEDCERLRYCDLSPDVRTLGAKCFSGCTRLIDVRLSRGLEKIGEQCFRNVPMTRIDLPYTVTDIGAGAFDGTKLTSLFLPAGALIANDDPGRMKNLTEYAVERGSKYYYAYSGVLYTADGTVLLSCPEALSGSVVVPDGVTTVGRNAFYGCSNVVRVDLPASVRVVEPYAFTGAGITAFELPVSMNTVPAHLLEECSSLRSVTLHDNVTTIEEYAFARCNRLTSLHLPDALTTLGEHAFYKCSSIPAIDVPGGVTALPLAVFQDCESATRITLPDGLRTIGKEAIRNCKSLVYIDIPSEVRTIEKEAFRDCKSLASIELPESLLSIGDNALRNTAIKELVLPAAVTHVGKKVTESCKLTRIVSLAVTPPELDKVNDTKVPLFVPATALSTYKEAKNWKSFKSINPL